VHSVGLRYGAVISNIQILAALCDCRGPVGIQVTVDESVASGGQSCCLSEQCRLPVTHPKVSSRTWRQ
jgi:hypothetical protein